MADLLVHELPADVEPTELSGSTVVVIDMLRASSTICFALAAGATCVVPLLEIEETRQLADQLGREYVVLGGERRGKIIDGFDLGNSPSEYTPQRVGGRMVLFTTTNGTRALAHASEAAHVLVGAAVNRATAARAVSDAPRVDILCAGTDGEVTGEDLLAAGAIVDHLLRDCANDHWTLNTVANGAHAMWQELLARADYSDRSFTEEFITALRETIGGRNLLAVGHQADIASCRAT